MAQHTDAQGNDRENDEISFALGRIEAAQLSLGLVVPKGFEGLLRLVYAMGLEDAPQVGLEARSRLLEQVAGLR